MSLRRELKNDISQFKMKDPIKRYKLGKIHFYLLGLILINFVIGITTGYRLNQNLTLTLKVILYLSGLILFLVTVRPFRKIAIYYAFYAFSGILTLLLLLFGGMFLAIISSLILFPVFPSQTVYKSNDVIVYERFQGFMANCCSYEVAERKLFLFEKKLGYFHIDEPIEPGNTSFTLSNNHIIYKHKCYQGDRVSRTRDTTQVLDLQ